MYIYNILQSVDYSNEILQLYQLKVIRPIEFSFGNKSNSSFFNI